MVATILAFIMVISTFSLLAVATNQESQPMDVSHNFDNRIYDYIPDTIMTYYINNTDVYGTVTFRTNHTDQTVYYGSTTGSYVFTHYGSPYFLSRYQDDLGTIYAGWNNNEWG